MSILKSRTTAVVAGALVVVGLGATGATAAQMITSSDIANETIRSWDVRNGTIKRHDLSPSVNRTLDKIEEAPQAAPGLTDVTTDGPYINMWEPSDGLQEAAVRCAEGKVAIGGGFSRADDGSYQDLQIVSSAPVFIEDDGTVLGLTNGWEPEDGKYVPNGWVVEGYNNGEINHIVRPHVICAAVD